MARAAIWRGGLAWGASCFLAAGLQAAPFDRDSLWFARLGGRAQEASFQRIDASGFHRAGDMQTPLGSMWKLFVYAYALERNLPTPDYVCRGGRAAKEEHYCCDPGQVVTRDTALAQSCGLFFDPGRLRIDALDWRRYWSSKQPDVAWIADLAQLQPARQVSVSSLLQVLSAINGKAREQAENALLAVVLNGRGQSALRYLGGRYRVKTFTWNHPQRPDSVIGGGAGWLSDGSAVWFGALGSSLQVLHDYGPQLAAAAETASGPARPGRCVDVAMFARYPIRRVRALADGPGLAPGTAQDLRGRFQVEFVNGQHLLLQADGEMRIEWDD